ncbi:Origin recognition complex subunit [Nesidiocoris tenuis]|uniref:Origin recognition complex subunit 1 n=1 Tax=Nesidiocoris tenuis TaxID=355587 RepID=A0ABN7B0U4_9HEMI|nr:Origin recognition complex subunit [Nesidiocoris tenuis]
MSSRSRKLDYIYYERRITDVNEIQSILVDDSEDEPEEWEVLTRTPRNGNVKRPTKTRLSQANSKTSNSLMSKATVESSSDKKEDGKVSPIKIKRKMSCPVDRMSSSKKSSIVTKERKQRLPLSTNQENISKELSKKLALFDELEDYATTFNSPSKKIGTFDDAFSITNAAQFEGSTPSKTSTPAKPSSGNQMIVSTKSSELASENDTMPFEATPRRSSGRKRSTLSLTGKSPKPRGRPKKIPTIDLYSSEDDEEELTTPLRLTKRKQESEDEDSPRRSLRKKTEPKKLESCGSNAKEGTSTPRRSARVSMSPCTPSLRQRVLLANTPRSSLPTIHDESVNEVISTPKLAKSAKKKLDMTPVTPKSCKKVGNGFLSPVVAERDAHPLSTPLSTLGIARAHLQVSTLPSSLPCREKEFDDIKSFVLRKLQDQIGGCMYISGVPGTGKTATVHTVVRGLQHLAKDGEIGTFNFVEVNGLRLTEPRQAYVRICQALCNSKVTTDQALRQLETKFLGKPKRSTLLLVDELDYLCNKRQDVIYNILDWTTKRFSKLIVLTIANTMDLPERTLKGKITSRMGLTRIVFHPYTFQQLERIVLNRLENCKAFHPDAVQLVARKVAAISGDARRALDICRRSTEILELDGRLSVSVSDIQQVLTRIFSGSRVQAIKNCSAMAKLVLRAIRDEVIRTGVEETTALHVYPQLLSLCAMDGEVEPTVTEFLAILSNLAHSGLIFAEKVRKDVHRKLSLNVSSDDIHYAISCSG